MDENINSTSTELNVPATAPATDNTAEATPPTAAEPTITAEPPKAVEADSAPPLETVSTAEEIKPDETTEKLKQLEAENIALKHGAKADGIGDLLALANARLSDNISLEQAIDSVIKQYPQFLGNDVGVEITTAGNTNNDPAAEDSDSKARRIMGLPPLK